MISAVEKRTVKEIKDFLEDMEKKATEFSTTMSQFKRRFADPFGREIYQLRGFFLHGDLKKAKITEKMAKEFSEVFASVPPSELGGKLLKTHIAVQNVVNVADDSARILKYFVNVLAEMKATLSKLEPPAPETGPITLIGKMVMVSHASSSAEESQVPEAGAKINQ
jgi:hypothetical protein